MVKNVCKSVKMRLSYRQSSEPSFRDTMYNLTHAGDGN